jgi:hypothetical protein
LLPKTVQPQGVTPDLLFLRQFFESDKGEKLLEVIHSDGFKKAVEALGGYDARRAGEILYQQ